MVHMNVNLKDMESSTSGDSDKDPCTEAPQIGATGWDPVEQGAGKTPLIGGECPPTSYLSSENLEGLTEKVGTLGLQATSKKHCGAAKKQIRRARLSEAPSGESGGGQPQSAPGSQPQTLQKPSTSGVQQDKSMESRRLPPGPSKQQKSARGTPKGGQAKRPKQVGQFSYARVAHEGLRVGVVCKNYPESQISKENFTDSQRAISRLVDELPKEGFTPRLADSYWAKGAAIMVCHDKLTKDWLAARVPTLVAWEGSRLNLVGLDALPTYKRVVAWFPGLAEDVEWYLLWLRRLNQGLDTRHWRVYERREESNGVCLVLSIDSGHILPSGRQVRGEEIRQEEEEEAEQVMVSTISFIQANLQHSIAASGILTRTVCIKGTVVSRGLYQGLEYSWIYPLLCYREVKT